MDKEKVLLKVMAFMERSERISIEDALQLFDEFNIGKIAAISRIPRERLHGRKCYFHSPVIDVLSLENVNSFVSKFSESINENSEGVILTLKTQEFQLTNILNFFKQLNEKFENLRVAISLDCIHELSVKSSLHIEDIIREMKSVFSLIIYDDFSSDITFEKRLEIYQFVFNQGIKPLAGIPYKIIDDPNEFVSKMDSIRLLQDEQNIFDFVYPFASHNYKANELHLSSPSAAQNLRAISISKIFLDNVKFIASLPLMITPELSYISLSYGADTINNFVNDKGINMMNNELIQLKVINEFDNVIGEELEVDGILKNQLTIQNRIIESKWIPTYINLQTEKIEVKL